MEVAIAAHCSRRKIDVEEAARVAGISINTLKSWMRLPEFNAAYLQARREVVSQTNARIQQNSGAAASVLFKLMADSATPASTRARAALGLLDHANKSLLLEDLEFRVVLLEQANKNQ